MAERRDELVARLDAGAAVEVDETAGMTLRELTEEVEPAFVDALAALADACRPFGVTIDAARLRRIRPISERWFFLGMALLSSGHRS